MVKLMELLVVSEHGHLEKYFKALTIIKYLRLIYYYKGLLAFCKIRSKSKGNTLGSCFVNR